MAVKLKYTPEKTGETALYKKDRVTYLTFPVLDQYSDDIVNAFSTRKGGFSKGCFKSMNLGPDRGDLKENVLFNYMEFCKAIRISINNIVTAKQEHSSDIRIVGEKDRGKGIVKEDNSAPVDGFITNVSGVTLCIQAADCPAVYLYDPVKNAIGLIHSGWKGTVDHISGKAVEMMEKEYGSKPENLIACIAPSICKECYEVGKDVYDAFSEAYSEEELPEIFGAGKDAAHYQLDLWKAIRITLERAGLKNDHIHVTDLCTCHNPDLFFSHRYTGGKRGNQAAFLMMKPEPVEKVELFKRISTVFNRK